VTDPSNPEGNHDECDDLHPLSEVDFANDGRVDRLTGLFAPEMFYLMLERELASMDRRANRSILLITFTLRSRSSVATKTAQLITLAQVLQSITRTEGLLSRLGRMTFIVVLGVDSDLEIELENSASQLQSKYSAIIKRYSDQIQAVFDVSLLPNWKESFSADRELGNQGVGEKVVRNAEVGNQSAWSGPNTIVGKEGSEESTFVDIDYLERRAGESLLDLLERARV
jgi:GGDEF domain-containing protein